MMNLFGISVPDDVAAAFLAAAASKRAGEAKKAYKPGDPFGKNEAPDTESKAKKSAGTAKNSLMRTWQKDSAGKKPLN